MFKGIPWSSPAAQRVKDAALSLWRLGSLPGLGISTCCGCGQKKKKKKKGNNKKFLPAGLPPGFNWPPCPTKLPGFPVDTSLDQPLHTPALLCMPPSSLSLPLHSRENTVSAPSSPLTPLPHSAPWDLSPHGRLQFSRCGTVSRPSRGGPWVLPPRNSFPGPSRPGSPLCALHSVF